MIKKKLLAVLALTLVSATALACPNGEGPCVEMPPDNDALGILTFYKSRSEAKAVDAIEALIKNGYVQTAATNSYECGFGGPVYTKDVQLCVEGRVVSFYNVGTNQVAFICEVNSLGATVSVNVICQAERLANDNRPPAKVVGTGVNAAVTSPANIAVGRRVLLEANAISAGISVVTTLSHRP